MKIVVLAAVLALCCAANAQMMMPGMIDPSQIGLPGLFPIAPPTGMMPHMPVDPRMFGIPNMFPVAGAKAQDHSAAPAFLQTKSKVGAKAQIPQYPVTPFGFPSPYYNPAAAGAWGHPFMWGAFGHPLAPLHPAVAATHPALNPYGPYSFPFGYFGGF